MKVKELKALLGKMNDDQELVVYSEDDKIRLFDVVDVASVKGTPSRDDSNRPVFNFDHPGTVEWVFIEVTRDF